MDPDKDLPPGVDPTRPSVARFYDLFLGGSEWLPIDKEAADRLLQVLPEAYDIANSNRIFLQRSVRWLAKHGIDQFLDVGAGLPTRWNSHEVAQEVNPNAHVVYVDNDPLILAHAQQLLEKVDHVAYISGDVRDPDGILNAPETRALIDFSRPVGLVMAAVYHFVAPDKNPYVLNKRYLDALVPGSYLSLSHLTGDGHLPIQVERFVDVLAHANEQMYFRSRAEVEEFFQGLELVSPYEGADPGVAFATEWGAHDPSKADESGTWLHCGLARKP